MPNNGAQPSRYRQKFHRNYEMISAAYHEAGHTVYGLLHFMKVSLVEIEQDQFNKIGGNTHYQNALDYDQEGLGSTFKKHLILSQLGFFYSGLEAEKYYFKHISGSKDYPYFLNIGASYDRSDAANIIIKYDLTSNKDKFEQKIIKNTLKELLDNWDAIVLIAHSLYSKKQLTYQDLKKLLCNKSEHKEFWRGQFKKIDEIFNESRALDINQIKSIMSS